MKFKYFLQGILIGTGLFLIGLGILNLLGRWPQNEIVFEVNRIRSTHGLPPLIENKTISSGAKLRARKLYDMKQYSHLSFQEDFEEMTGMKAVYIGENLARNFKSDRKVVEAWYLSQLHRDVILEKNYHYIGVGKCRNYVVLWASSKPIYFPKSK